MSGYYVYGGDASLGKEPLGSEGRFIWKGVTQTTAVRRARRAFRQKPFRLFHFSNFYNDESFTEVKL